MHSYQAKRLWQLPLVVLCTIGASHAIEVSIPNEATSYPQGISQINPATSQCIGCHGPQGISQFPDWPNLAGLSSDYIITEVDKFKHNKRHNDMMHVVASDVSGQSLHQAANYFSQQKIRIEDTAKFEKPKGIKACTVCHSDTHLSTSDVGPHLAGQKQSYLTKQLIDYQTGQRQNSIMQGIVKSLSMERIHELARYYSHLPITLDEHSKEVP